MVRNGRDWKRKQRRKSRLRRRFIQAPYLLTTIPLSESSFRLRGITQPGTASFFSSLLFRFTFAFIESFSSVSISTFNVNQERNTEKTVDAENRSVESRWHVESLNHGVVQWLQGRRKPRVGCAGQNGPSSTGIFSPVQHAPSVVLFFVAFVASKNKIPAIDMMEGSNDIRWRVKRIYMCWMNFDYLSILVNLYGTLFLSWLLIFLDDR